MKPIVLALAFALLIPAAAFAHGGHPESLPLYAMAVPAAVPPATPTLTGKGAHKFMMDPTWGRLADGSPVGPTHGGVAIDGEGRIYVSTDAAIGICVFEPDGTLLKLIAPECAGTHSLVYREEDGKGYLYGAHLKGQRVVKLDLDGNLVMSIEDSEDIPGGFKGLTAVAVAPNGDIFAATGYGANHIHKFSPDGKRIMTFGEKGEGDQAFHTCHGMVIDTRFGEPRLLIADRENRRLVHYTLDGEQIGVYASGLRRPCSMSFRGDLCAVAELEGRVTLLGLDGKPVVYLGDNPDQAQWAQFKVPLDQIGMAVFTAPHGICFDKTGNLYVQDWNQTGRVTKLSSLK